jgi:DNA polymerase-3 subunit epsilon
MSQTVAPGSDPGRREIPSFAAIDFETADYGRDSACALAVIRVERGAIVDRRSWLIRPPRPWFRFTAIHGITWRDVRSAPLFAHLWPAVALHLRGVEFLAAHNASFDRSVLRACCAVAGVPAPELDYVCTVGVARQVWRIRPTALPNVCDHLGLALKHHDALSDAEACARIVIAAWDDGWRPEMRYPRNNPGQAHGGMPVYGPGEPGI